MSLGVCLCPHAADQRSNSLTLTLQQINHLPECSWVNRGRSRALRCVKLHMFSKKASKRVDRTRLVKIIEKELKPQLSQPHREH